MFEAILFFTLGLIVGWNFLKQPKWVSDTFTKVVNYFESTKK